MIQSPIRFYCALLIFLCACQNQVPSQQTINQPQENNTNPVQAFQPEITVNDINAQKYHQSNPSNIVRIDDQLYYLKNAGAQLYRLDLKTQKEEVLLEAKNIGVQQDLSEDQRMVLERLRQGSSGFLKFRKMSNQHLMIFQGGGILVYHIQTQKYTSLHLKHQPINLAFNPQYGFLTYYADQMLWLQHLTLNLDALKGDPIPLVNAKKQVDISYGEAEFIAQEEMERDYGYQWSEQSNYLAYTMVDERQVGLQKRMSLSAKGNALIEQKYPATGGENAKVKLFVSHFPTPDQITKAVKSIALEVPKDMEYLARFEFGLDDHLWIQWQSRDQKTLKLYQAKPPAFKLEEVITETSSTWVDLHDDFIDKPNYFIWSSSRDGIKQLFAVSKKDKKFYPLSKNDGAVHHVITDLADQLYFSKSTRQGLEKQIFVVDTPQINLNEESRLENLHLTEKQISRASGHHQMSFIGDQYYLHTFHHITQPSQLHLIKASAFDLDENNQPTPESKSSAVIPLSQPNPLFSALTKPKVEYHSIPAKDGSLLNLMIFYPIAYQENQKYPTLAYGYAGPTSQTVTNAWSNNNLLWMMLAHHQYIVYSVDNRGTPNREEKFSHASFNQIGNIEAEDHITAAKWMMDHIKGVDAQRMGVYGWSYGGYLTGLLMSTPNHPYRTGISVAPVTDWKLYDTHYTERYMGTPQNNTALYESSSLSNRVQDFKGDLLLVHGMSDDNVLFDNTVMWMNGLQNQGVMFELMTYPGDGHAINQENHRAHLYKTMFHFLERKLKN